uniref:Uncharacterized protein n=1 Tax=Anopheles stephensi TaxID=30069 RepID=A0A182YSN2_ANOST
MLTMLEQETFTTANETIALDTNDPEVYGSVVYEEDAYTSGPSAPAPLPPRQVPVSEFDLFEALLNTSAGGPMGSFWNTSAVATETPYTPYELRPETVHRADPVRRHLYRVLGNGTLIIVFLRHRAMRNVPNT